MNLNMSFSRHVADRFVAPLEGPKSGVWKL